MQPLTGALSKQQLRLLSLEEEPRLAKRLQPSAKEDLVIADINLPGPAQNRARPTELGRGSASGFIDADACYRLGEKHSRVPPPDKPAYAGATENLAEVASREEA
ncbi:MAG: hypothetical protein HOY79_05290 [Streptomyces sp.]|nr:hypothetical protein [Streptomyces sp.]